MTLDGLLIEINIMVLFTENNFFKFKSHLQIQPRNIYLSHLKK